MSRLAYARLAIEIPITREVSEHSVLGEAGIQEQLRRFAASRSASPYTRSSSAGIGAPRACRRRTRNSGQAGAHGDLLRRVALRAGLENPLHREEGEALLLNRPLQLVEGDARIYEVLEQGRGRWLAGRRR